jgi:hypothetical protein
MNSPMTKKVLITVVIIFLLLLLFVRTAKASDTYYQSINLLNQNNSSQLNMIGIGFRISFDDIRLIPNKICFRLFSGYNEKGNLSEYDVCK